MGIGLEVFRQQANQSLQQAKPDKASGSKAGKAVIKAEDLDPQLKTLTSKPSREEMNIYVRGQLLEGIRKSLKDKGLIGTQAAAEFIARAEGALFGKLVKGRYDAAKAGEDLELKTVGELLTALDNMGKLTSRDRILLKEVARMVYGSGVFEEKDGGKGYIGMLGDVTKKTLVVKFKTHKSERNNPDPETLHDELASCNNLRNALLRVANELKIDGQTLANIKLTLGLGPNDQNANSCTRLLLRTDAAKVLKEFEKVLGEGAIWKAALKYLDTDILKSSGSTRFADVKKRVEQSLARSLVKINAGLSVTRSQLQAFKVLTLDDLKATIPGKLGAVDNKDIELKGFSSVANGKYILCNIAYTQVEKKDPDALKKNPDTTEVRVTKHCQVLMDRDGRLVDPLKTDYGKIRNSFSADAAWMADIFSEDDLPVVADFLGKLNSYTKHVPYETLKPYLASMLPGVIRKIRNGGAPKKITVKDLMRELHLDTLVKEKKYDKYVTGKTDIEKMVKAFLVKCTLDALDFLDKSQEFAGTQAVKFSLARLKPGDGTNKIDASLLLDYLTLPHVESTDQTNDQKKLYSKKQPALVFLSQYFLSFGNEMSYTTNLLYSRHPVFPRKESYQGGCVMHPYEQMIPKLTDDNLGLVLRDEQNRMIDTVFMYRDQEIMTVKNPANDSVDDRKKRAKDAVTKLRNEGFFDLQIYTALQIPGGYFATLLTTLGAGDLAFSGSLATNFAGMKITFDRDKDGNMVAHYQKDNLKSKRFGEALTLEYEVRISPDGRMECTNLEAYQVQGQNKIPIVMPSPAQTEMLSQMDEEGLNIADLQMANDGKTILCKTDKTGENPTWKKIEENGVVSTVSDEEYKRLKISVSDNGAPKKAPVGNDDVPKKAPVGSNKIQPKVNVSTDKVQPKVNVSVNKAPPVTDPKQWKQVDGPADLMDEKMLRQSNNSNCCWLFSVINGLKFTKEGRNHLGKLVGKNTGSVTFYSGSGNLVRTMYSGGLKFSKMPAGSSFLEKCAMTHALSKKMIPDKTLPGGGKEPWKPGQNGDMEAPCKMLGLVPVPTSTNITDMDKKPSYDDYGQEITRHLGKGEIATLNKGNYHFVSIVGIKNQGGVYYVQTVDSLTAREEFVSLQNLLEGAWGPGDSTGKRAALYFMQRPAAYKGTADKVSGMLNELTSEDLKKEIESRKSWHDENYKRRKEMGPSQAANSEDDMLRRDLIGELLQEFDFNDAKARFASFLGKEAGWREIPGWEAHGFDLTTSKGVQKLFADWLISEHFRANNQKASDKKDVGNVVANEENTNTITKDGVIVSDNIIREDVINTSSKVEKKNQKPDDKNLDELEGNLASMSFWTVFDTRSLVRSYDPVVVEQMNFLLPLLAKRVDSKDHFNINCLICMMPEAVEKVREKGGFGEDRQKNFEAIWNALRFEGSAPRIPEPGDEFGMKKLAGAILNALADRIAKDIADAMGGKEAVKELSADFKEFLTQKDNSKREKLIARLDKMMRKLGNGSFCSTILADLYRAGLGTAAGLRYSHILACMKNPSSIPTTADFYWVPEDGPLSQSQIPKTAQGYFSSYTGSRYPNLGFWLDGKKLDPHQPEDALKALKDEKYNFSPRQIARATLYLDQILNIFMLVLALGKRDIKVSFGKTTSGDLKVSFAFPACERNGITRLGKKKYSWRDNRDVHDTFVHDVVIHEDGSYVTQPIWEIKAPKLTMSQMATYQKIIKGKGVKTDSVRYNVAEDHKTIYCRYSDKNGFHEVAIDGDGLSMTVDDFKRRLKG